MIPTVPSAPRVLITRAPQQGSELAERLRALGAEPVLIPAIETVEPTSFAALDAALAQLETFHWLLFTSANAVEAFASRLSHFGGGIISAKAGPPLLSVISTGARSAQQRDPCFSLARAEGASLPLYPANSPRIAAIGPATARALEKIGLTPDLIPPQAVAESLTESLLPQVRQADGTSTRFLLIRAEDAREHLPETLRAAGGEVTVAPGYRTVIPAASVDLLRELFSDPVRHPDAITFTSSSTARNLLALCEAAQVTVPETALRISIGPITSQTLRELGLSPHAEAPEATVPCLAETVMATLQQYRP